MPNNKISSSGPSYPGAYATEQSAESSSAALPAAARPAASDDLNILQQRKAGSEDRLNLHAIWTSVSRYAPARSSQRSYREKMAEAYITASFAANRAGKNVDTSLWTDMGKNLSALLKPVVMANGSELEIPHSMIAKSRLQVHPQSDIEDMIGAVEDPGLRKMLTRIYHHPLSENVGARSDLLRHLCGMLDKGKVNVYMDIDDLTRALTAQVLTLKENANLALEDIVEMSEVDRAKLLIESIGNEMINHRMQNRTIVVPPSIGTLGHLTFEEENSMQAQVPGHNQGKRIAMHMLMSMDSGVYDVRGKTDFVQELALKYQSDRTQGYEAPLKFIACFTRLSAVAPDRAANKRHYSQSISTFGKMAKAGGPALNRHLIDHFRFAESVRQSQGDLQDELDSHASLINEGHLPADEQQRVLDKITARYVLFNHCMQLIQGAVNVSTFISQIASHDKAKDESSEDVEHFQDLFRHVAGNFPYLDESGGWTGELKVNCYIAPSSKRLTRDDMAEAFSTIRDLVLKRLNGGYQVS